jgi:thiamine biosynthesis protein ThiI
MTVIDQAAHMPVFRPLVGMDKEEIIGEAQRLGTFDISIVPDQDSCTLFTPRHPETHARRHTIDQVERTLPVDTMIQSAVDGAAVEQLSYPVVE